MNHVVWLLPEPVKIGIVFLEMMSIESVRVAVYVN
jgi:hypothetical protein